ncbi:MAG: phospholipase D-like domain-containing protein [Methanoregula sp.]|nr:phospholipase D-like domain-containing protein [Methanoregula sp.]
MHAAAAVQIVEFCPDPHSFEDADEYLVLSGTGSLDGFTISDGEGGFRFPPGTRINGLVTVARSGTAFKQSHGIYPDFEWLDYSQLVPDVIKGDTLRLANANDALMLYDKGILVQNIAWPGDVKPREGQIHFLDKGVWDPRPLMIGQSRLSPAVFRNVSITTFVSPDSSSEIFSYAVNQASDEILLNVYEFSSPLMADSLITAHARDVDIKVIIEGGPVGGISPEGKEAIRMLTDAGIPVSMMVSRKGDPAPYRYDHAKYMVIDRQAILLTSENFKYSGFPPAGMTGNRGWGVYLEDPGLAEYFSTVYLTDSGGKSMTSCNGSAGTPESKPSGKYIAEFQPGYFTNASVRPVISPDTSSQIIDLINSAERSIEIEQAYITNETTYSLNPYLSAAINASRRGVHVRVLLDSYWYNIEDETDNDEMVALVNRIGLCEHIPLEARCADLSTSGIEKIHNKGVIVDDQYVLVSSINWNSNSPNFNREAGVIIDHPGVARYFLDVFEDDWNSTAKLPADKTDYLKIAVAGVVLVILILLYYHRQKV